MNTAVVNVFQDTGLPLELRGALDVIARELTDPTGHISAEVSGSQIMVDELSRYGHLSPSPDVLILLLVAPEEAAAAISSTAAIEVWTLTAGRLGAVLGPLRSRSASRTAVSKNLAVDRWRDCGFECRGSIGIQGPGAIAWAIGERICRRRNRPDLADRCRIGMFRTLLTARPLYLGTIKVTHYQRSTDT